MTRPAILSEPEKWVAVPVEPIAYLSGAYREFIEGRRDRVPLGVEVSLVNLNWAQQIPLYARPDPTALANLVAYAEGLEGRVEHLELEAEGQRRAKRELAEKLGCEDEPRWKWMNLALTKIIQRAETAEARVIELERRLAEAEKVIEPFAQYRTADGIGDGSDFLRIPDGHPLLWNMRSGDDMATMENLIEVRHLRAARAWKDGK